MASARLPDVVSAPFVYDCPNDITPGSHVTRPFEAMSCPGMMYRNNHSNVLGYCCSKLIPALN